ncbi:MAG: hypothetical protein DI535_02020 [Citrobacter freundii]|nr:MAG: hypothetical protein DI535_02020 [Citrobacter freundii]
MENRRKAKFFKAFGGLKTHKIRGFSAPVNDEFPPTACIKDTGQGHQAFIYSYNMAELAPSFPE